MDLIIKKNYPNSVINQNLPLKKKLFCQYCINCD